MSSAINSNIVHESEAQRQHVRVKLPGSIQFVADGRERKYRLLDISAGGFSFESAGEGYTVGETYTGLLLFSVDNIGFTIAVAFEVAISKGVRFGCVFQDLGAGEIGALRQVLTTYLGGELVSVGDMLATLSRENTSPARVAKSGGALRLPARIRALAGTGLALAIGIVAFGYTATRVYDIVIVTHAVAAKISAQTYTITMPRDGTFFSLLPADGRLKKGQPIGSFQTGLLDVVAGVPGSFKLSPEDLTQLIGQQLKGSLGSPCDCLVKKVFVTDEQYVLRNQSVVELVPQDSRPYLLARFHYDEIGDIPVGRKVHFRLNGSDEKIEGRITELRVLPAQTIDANGLNDLNGLNTNAAITDVIAVIVPSVVLDMSHIDEPVDVRIDPLATWFT